MGASSRLLRYGPFEKQNNHGQIRAQITFYSVTLNDVLGIVVGEPSLTFGANPRAQHHR